MDTKSFSCNLSQPGPRFEVTSESQNVQSKACPSLPISIIVRNSPFNRPRQSRAIFTAIINRRHQSRSTSATESDRLASCSMVAGKAIEVFGGCSALSLLEMALCMESHRSPSAQQRLSQTQKALIDDRAVRLRILRNRRVCLRRRRI